MTDLKAEPPCARPWGSPALLQGPSRVLHTGCSRHVPTPAPSVGRVVHVGDLASDTRGAQSWLCTSGPVTCSRFCRSQNLRFPHVLSQHNTSNCGPGECEEHTTAGVLTHGRAQAAVAELKSYSSLKEKKNNSETLLLSLVSSRARQRYVVTVQQILADRWINKHILQR